MEPDYNDTYTNTKNNMVILGRSRIAVCREIYCIMKNFNPKYKISEFIVNTYNRNFILNCIGNSNEQYYTNYYNEHNIYYCIDNNNHATIIFFCENK